MHTIFAFQKILALTIIELFKCSSASKADAEEQCACIMSSEALHPSIDSILMPPPPKRLREEGLVRADVEFSMACEHRNAAAVSSMHQSQHASCALDRAGNESILDMRQQGATIGAAALPDTINFVTPPPKTLQTTTSEDENGETTTAYSETDSMQSERSTVIVDSMESEKRRDEDMPVTTTTRFSDIIGHASVKLRIDEMLLPLALPPSLSESILTGVRSLPACLLLYGPPGCGKVRVDGNDFLCSSLQYRLT